MKRKLIILSIIGLILSVGLDAAFQLSYGPFVWSGIPGFFALFGLVGCLAIIVISKWIGQILLQRREDYYDPYERGDEHE